MKVQGIDHQQMLELQRAALVRTNQERQHNQNVEDINRLRKETDIKMQELRTERNRRLGNVKGQNVDIDC
jgi:protein tyrosine/serine phosphatase